MALPYGGGDQGHLRRQFGSPDRRRPTGSQLRLPGRFQGDIYDPSVSLGVLVPEPSAPHFLTPVAQNGSVSLTLISTPGFTYQIQASTNLTSLTNWTTLTNFTSTNGTNQFIDTNVNSFSHRYYRAVFTN